MRIRTLLNKCEHLESFVYEREYWEQKDNKSVLIIDIAPRKNRHPICSGCVKLGGIYDHKQTTRDFSLCPCGAFRSTFVTECGV